MSESLNRFRTAEAVRSGPNGAGPYHEPEPKDPVGDSDGVEIEPGVSDIIDCIFGLGEAKQTAFEELRAHPWSSAEELSEFLDLDRSNVNRSLTYLLERGLVTRRRRILRQGGYVYEYHVRSPVRIRDTLLDVFDDWSRTARKRISQFVFGEAQEAEGNAWIVQLVLAVSGRVTATEEYVFHHGVEVTRRAGDPIPEAVERGEWSPELRDEFVAKGSRAAVTDALERLAADGYLERIEPASEDQWDGPYWRLTSSDGRS